MVDTLELEGSIEPQFGGSRRRPRGFSIEPYDSNKAVDRARQMIAIWLLVILLIIIAAAFFALIWVFVCSPASGKDNFDHLAVLLNIVFGPVVTLVGSATGFYFGASRNIGPPSPPQQMPAQPISPPPPGPDSQPAAP